VVGAEFEANLSFSALHQLALPLQDDVDRLDGPSRDALNVALGLSDGTPPDRLVLARAVLALLSQAAAGHPVLVAIDDTSWLDRASAVVLGLVARRLAGRRVGLLATWRSGAESFFDHGDLPVHDLRPLTDAAAAALLTARFPDLPARVRTRLLAEARGNPLALLELPAALDDPRYAAGHVLPALLPLSRRLLALFASRVGGLPAPTRRLLLLAALEGTGDLGVLPGAARGQREIEDLAPAELAGLVRIDEGTGQLVFRHPLTRSAVVELSSSKERREAHTALAGQLAGQPERRAWHLAEAATGPDEGLAGLLERVAYRNLRRGDATGAVAGLLRAADLSADGAGRSRRLAEAAYVGADVTGELRSVPELLAEARQADPDLSASLPAAIAASYLLLNGDGDVDTAHRLLAAAIETHAHGADTSTFIEALYTLLLVCFFGGRPELWQPFRAAIARLTPPVPAVLALLGSTFADPARATASALDQLDATISTLRDETDPVRVVRIGIAAHYVDRLDGCREALRRVVLDGRRGGAVTSAIDALFLLSAEGWLAGRWDETQELAEEGLALCDEFGYRILAWPGMLHQALLAAARGHYDRAQALAGEMARWAAPRRVGAIQGYACHVRALAALGHGDFEDAYQHAAAISPPGVFASWIPHALWVPMDLVEAAVLTGRDAEAAAHVTAMHDARLPAISPRLALITAGSAAIAARDRGAAGLFEQALAVPGAERWPFDLARVQLAYGERLRRARAVSQARQQLRAALSTFQHLQARPWADRAGHELRATGLAVGPVSEVSRTSLTGQEFQIATLAAAGLSNKQIAERLQLSPRTVSAHLYRIFPKLGVTARAALRDALTGLAVREPDR